MMLKLKLQYFVQTHWKTLWCWEGLGARGEGDDRGWDGWMASPTRWTWIWVNSGSWWWTGRSGLLRFMGSQRVGHDSATELNWLAIVSGEQKRDSAIHVHVAFLPKTPLPSRLPHKIEQSSMLYSSPLLVRHFKYSVVYMCIQICYHFPPPSPWQP